MVTTLVAISQAVQVVKSWFCPLQCIFSFLQNFHHNAVCRSPVKPNYSLIIVKPWVEDDYLMLIFIRQMYPVILKIHHSWRNCTEVSRSSDDFLSQLHESAGARIQQIKSVQWCPKYDFKCTKQAGRWSLRILRKEAFRHYMISVKWVDEMHPYGLHRCIFR